MSISRYIGLYTVLVVLALMTGCHYASGCQIVNNTGEPITIHLSETGSYDLADGEWSGFSSDVVILDHTQGAISRRYSTTFKRLPSRFINYSSRIHFLAHRYCTLQIEPDGSVYAIYPEQLKPARNIPPQPQGYPMRPLD